MADTQTKFDIDFDPKDLPHGLYEIFWKDTHGGGSSEASVGSDRHGNRWLAPTNWIFNKNGPTFDWSGVASVQRIVGTNYPTENITLTRTKENGDYVSYSISPNSAYNKQIINAAIERIKEL